MSTSFPTGLDSFTAKTDHVDTVTAATINVLQDAVAAMQGYSWLTGLLTGSGVPGAGLGNNTNLYLDTATGIIYRKTAGTWAAIYTPSGGSAGTGLDIVPTLGVTTFPRSGCNATPAIGSGFTAYTGFVPQASFTAGHIQMYCSTSSSPSSAFVGLYSIDASGNGTQIAVSASTVSLGTLGPRPVALTVPVSLVAGHAYAVGVLFVGASFNTVSAAGPAGATALGGMTKQPFLYAFNTAGGATVLPASFTAGALTFSNGPLYAEILV